MSAASLDLSIIVLTYNTLDLTRACIRSILADSTECSVEVIVVDNGSTDDTAETIQKEFPTIYFIQNAENLGFARGNNIGLEASHGRYLLLLNSDTRVLLGALNALISFMDTHSDAGACGPMLLNEDGSLQPSGRELPTVWSVFLGMTHLYRLWKKDFYFEQGRDYNAIKQVREISGAALLVRREAYEELGGLDPNLFAYYEDIDWCKRIGDAGYAIYYVPGAKVIHRWHGTSQSMSELSYRTGQDSLRYYFQKHHGAIAQIGIRILLVLKEIALFLVALLRLDRVAIKFHRRTLANMFNHLPPVSGH